MKPGVAAVVATFRRTPEISRLLESLKACRPCLVGVVIVDNGSDPATKAAFDESGIPGLYLPQTENAGCGGGLRIAEQAAVGHFGTELTHLWILDDDAVVLPGALDLMLKAAAGENADVVSSMILNGDGSLGNYPGLLDPEKFRAIRELSDLAAFINRCGSAPVPFSWSTGISMLVSRKAVDAIGFHRDDFWVRGEDLEYSLRITYRHKGIMVPDAQVKHIAPPPAGAQSQRSEYLKHCAMLQNLCYISFRLPHGRRILRTLPGNFRRFLKTWPPGQGIKDAILAFWLGAVGGKPAGVPSGDHFKRRIFKKLV